MLWEIASVLSGDSFSTVEVAPVLWEHNNSACEDNISTVEG